MAKGGKGGMQTAGLHYSICCPKCGKSAARAEETGNGMRYLHFTRKGSVWHEVKSAPSAAQDTTLAWAHPQTDADFRAITPPGFARAFYEANK